ncbi:MAG: S46 family peptidase [Pyrinomonadaceae bacterium]
MKIAKRVLFSYVLTATMLLSSFSFVIARPDEGMYTPGQIAGLPLKGRGLKIKPTDIYNPGGAPAIADAIVRVNIGEAGGFGTGEFVSPNGLILTNHHVAFDALVAASTPERDYAKLGYKADSQANELPAKDYSLLLTSRVEDVTAQVTKGTENLTGDRRKATIDENIKNLQTAEQAKAGEGKTIRIQELNSGLFYYLYETTTIRDVRVVYAPPQSIGFFGGDPDNFEWTRHTGDFTFLRAYVGPDGKPAAFSPNNVPFKPKKHLTISLSGVRPDEFVMVLGYPGGTTRYRESQAVAYAQDVNFPFIVGYLSAWAGALQKIGEADDEKRVKLQAEIFSLNNSIKAYDGGVVALRRADVISQKRAEEARFRQWIDADPARKAKYGDILPRIAALSDEFYRTATRDRITRTLPRPDIMPVFKQLLDAYTAIKAGKKLTDDKRGEIAAAFKDREPLLETEMMRYYLSAIGKLPAGERLAAADSLFGSGPQRRRAEEAFIAKYLADFDTPEKIAAVYEMTPESFASGRADLASLLAGIADARAAAQARLAKFNAEIDPLRLAYQRGMSEMKRSTPYPDANATLRFTFGNVRGYRPREAVTYDPFTTLRGVIEKDTGVDPFAVPQGLKDLQAKKDLGRYGVGDSVPVNFLATTDIIGGNSGSPILNGRGEQVGIVFDGNYEGLGNDIFYDPARNRTIAVDIRYVLFVTEKFGGAGWVLNEMSISGGSRSRGTAG